MKELRSLLEDATVKNLQFEETYSRDFPLIKINNQWIKIHIPYDSILDAVIEALPKGKQIDFVLKNDISIEENKDRFYRYGGYDFALEEVKQMLLAAKEDK